LGNVQFRGGNGYVPPLRHPQKILELAQIHDAHRISPKRKLPGTDHR
jgi:hypothetical protein